MGPASGPPNDSATRRVEWWHSLRVRLVLWAGLGSVVLIFAIATAFYLTTRTMLINNTRAEMRGLAEQTALSLDGTLGGVQVGTREIVQVARHPELDATDLRAVLNAAVESDPDTVGAMLIVEPGELAPGDPGFSWYVRRDGDRLVESTVEDLGYDVEAMPWYRRTVIDGESWWSEPYANAATGGQVFVTYNMPVPAADGRIVGMASLDVPLQHLVDRLGTVPEANGLRPMLLSPQRLILTHPSAEVRMRRTFDEYVEAARSDLMPLLEAMRERRRAELAHVVASDIAGSVRGEHRYSFAVPVGDTGWTFALTVSRDFLLARLNRITRWIAAAGLLAVLLGVALVRRMATRVAQPIEDLTESARLFSEGEFDVPLRHGERRDEVGLLARVIDRARTSIRRQLDEIAALGAARARIEGELKVANDIQQAMLPADADFAAGDACLQVAGRLEPAKAVGGDFFDFFLRDDDTLWFMIGDVSDKGVPAAMFMARTMTVLEVAAHFGYGPDRALRDAARFLIHGNDTCMFATVLCGTLALRTGELVLASAAHEPPVLIRADGRREFAEVPTAAPLGIDVADAYPLWRGRLAPGDTLLAYTDGVTEEFHGDEPFGRERLLAALDAARDAAAQGRALYAAVHGFAAGGTQADDIAVLVLRLDAAAGGDDT
jgi:sigma-B regulation protein RsbU (phosphoserine phosphatase)